MKCKNILESIGTHAAGAIEPHHGRTSAEVYVKVDYMNPGGSVKDRIGVMDD